MLAVVAVVIALLLLVGTIVAVVYIVRSGSKNAKEGPGQGLGAIEALHVDASRTNDGAVVFVHNSYTFNVSMSTGKHAHFTVSLVAGGGSYPGEFTPTDDEIWDRRYRVKTQPCIEFTRETRFQRFGKWLGISREVQTGDPGFDDTIYIDSTAPDDLIIDALRRAEVRAAIVKLLAAGYTRVSMFRSNSPLLITTQNPPINALSKESHAEQLGLLSTIARGMPAVHVENAGKVATDRPTMLTVLAGLGSFAAFLGVAITSDMWKPLDDGLLGWGLLAGLAAWISALPMLILLMRGHSNAFGSLVGSWLCLLVGLPCLGLFVAKGANAWPDTSAAETVPARVTDKNISKGKSTTYSATFDLGKEFGGEFEFSVDSSLFYDLSYWEPAYLVLYDGYLGWTWVDEIKASR